MMQVLISFEEEYRIYMEIIAAAIRQARPGDEVVVTQRATLEEEKSMHAARVSLSPAPGDIVTRAPALCAGCSSRFRQAAF